MPAFNMLLKYMIKKTPDLLKSRSIYIYIYINLYKFIDIFIYIYVYMHYILQDI